MRNRRFRIGLLATAVATAGIAAAATSAVAAAPAGQHPLRALPPAHAATFAFGAPVSVSDPLAPTETFPTKIGIGKVLGDGHDDLVLVSRDETDDSRSTVIDVYPPAAGGTLGQPVAYRMAGADSDDNRITIADLYGDGRQEIVLPEGTSTTVVSYSGGHFSHATLAIPADYLLVGDFTGDGRPDLVAANRLDGTVKIYAGNAQHAFTLWRTVDFVPYGAGVGIGSVWAGDFDRNGHLDLAYLRGDGFGVRRQTAAGTFAAQQDYKLAQVGNAPPFPEDMVTGDVTGDGYSDVIVATMGNGTQAGVEVFAGGPGTTLKAPKVYHTLDAPGPIAVADLNGDGHGDLVIQHNGFYDMGVMLEQPGGTLGPESLYPGTGGTPTAPSCRSGT